VLTLFALRHASTEWNELGLMQGRRDMPLSAKGRADIARWRLPSRVPPDVVLLSSPLLRAVDTATLMCRRSPRIEPALIEMDWGRWEGRTLDDARRADPVAYDANAGRGLDFRPPGGESPREVAARVAAWLESMASTRTAALAVTHRGVLRAMLSLATGWDMRDKPPLRLQDACLHRFAVRPDGGLALEQPNIALVPPGR
jgi:probable phosphoglycerate mutase